MNQKKVSMRLFIILGFLVLAMIGCSVPANEKPSSNKEKQVEDVTMPGNLNIKIDSVISLTNPNINYSIVVTEYTVTSLEITVTYVSTNSVVGTFNWTPDVGSTTYSLDISLYGEYQIRVVQTAVHDGDTITSEESTTVNIQPLKLTIVTIVPGGSLDVVIDGDASSDITYAAFPENFDSTEQYQVPKGWAVTTYDETYAGVANYGDAHSSPNCLKLFDESDTHEASAYAMIEDSTYGQLSYFFKISGTPEPTTNSYCKILDSYGDWMIDVCFNDGQKVEVRKPDGEKIPLMHYDFNTWYKIEIRWDKSTGYVKTLINDIDYGNYQIIKEPSDTMNYIQFHAGTSVDPGTTTTMYIDDVNLTTNTEVIASQEFTENFDTTPLNEIPAGFNQVEHENVFVGVVDSGVIPHSLPNCLKLSDDNTSDVAIISRGIGNQTYGQLTFYQYVTASSPWAGFLVEGAISLYFQDDGTIWCGGTGSTIGTYTKETWTKVEIRWDAYKRNCRVFIDDNDLGKFEMYGIPLSIRFYTSGLDSGHLNYIDDISLTLNAEFIE